MIGPGIPNPMLFAGGDPLDELGKVDRSLRFRSPATAYISRTPGSAATDGKKWTWSGWVKRGQSSSGQMTIFAADNGASDSQGLYLHTDDSLRFSTGASLNRFTTALYRDYGGHFHVCVAADSSQATENDRLKLFVNGAQIAWSSSVAVGLNGLWKIGAQSVLQGMGKSVGSPAATSFDGYVSNVAFVDGQALTPAAFAATHPRTGQWRPIGKGAIRAAVAVGGGARNGWGANGYLLPFDDTTSLTTLLYDRSQSDTDTAGGNWTATNISLTAGTTYDSSLDTPTNNFCVLNPLAWRNGTGQPTYSNGSLDVLNTSGVYETYTLGTMSLPSWETYFEVTVLATGGSATPFIGVADRQVLANVQTNLFGYQLSGQKVVGGVLSAYGAAFTTNDVIGVRVKPSANEVEFYKQTGGTGSFVSQGVITMNSGVEYFSYIDVTLNGKVAVNYGQRPFNNATPPAAAKANCTKNLPVKPAGLLKPSGAFVAVADSGANIAASLAAARAGFGSYIDIIKRRDATAEGWRWIFSDDPTNYIDTANSATAKAAVPAFGGTSYVGYSLKVSAANGVATGTFAHTNGVADTITDGLSNSRKMVILHRESAGGGSFYCYHPDCTAGKLLYLDAISQETTDASISSITASSFVAAAALPSGTYRWISIAEMDGGVRFLKNIGNGSATDGAFGAAGVSPLLAIGKCSIGTTSEWNVHDNARSPTNQDSNTLQLQSTGGEGSNATIDKVSSGIKSRSASFNASGFTYLYVLFPAFTFRYANAR